jgi:hypothetical protein
MIDYVKIWTNELGLAEKLRRNPELDFFIEKNTKTDEEKDGKEKTDVKNLSIVINPSGRVQLSGSLHKFTNDGIHNYDDFTYERLVETIGKVSALLETAPDRLTIHNIEFGVNIRLDSEPKLFLDKILNYCYKLPETKPFSSKGQLMQWDHQNYIVKVYNKKRQCRIDTNILRFEVKIMAMVHLAGVEIRTLADLLDKAKLRRLGVELYKTYQGLIIGEKLNTNQMSAPERKIYEEGMNPHFWRDLKDRKKRSYSRKRFENVIKKYGTGLREKIGQIITEKVSELLKSSDILPDS